MTLSVRTCEGEALKTPSSSSSTSCVVDYGKCEVAVMADKKKEKFPGCHLSDILGSDRPCNPFRLLLDP